MENKKEHYGLVTATTMIVGIVIGSGIFFKSDDILKYTGGSLLLGIVVLCIGAFSIIFGSLTLTEISMRTKKNGGIVGYFEELISVEVASAFGWFQTFVYYPTIGAVVSWVSAIYICQLFEIEASFKIEILIAFIIMTVIYGVNIVSLRVAGYFQNISTIIKLIPLIGIAVIGFFWGGAAPVIPEGIKVVTQSNVGFNWIAALAPIAFSYDGWVIATSITHEVKNPKKNMTLALILGPLIILTVYLSYFIGLNKMLGAEYIMSMGNGAVNKIGELLLGAYGQKIMLIIIIISILGVVNGITLGSLRMPQALASKKMLPKSGLIEKINPKYELSLWSCLISYGVAVFWLMIHYITQSAGLFKGGDISEISIVFSYVAYTVLYIKVIKMRREGVITSFFKGILCPIFGILGSVIILIGGILSNPKDVIAFIIFCLLFSGFGFYYYLVSNKKS